MADAWMRSYPSGHRARITRSFETTYLLEVFTPSGERLLEFALLMPSLELAQETADFVVNGQGEPWVPVTRGTFTTDLSELHVEPTTAQRANVKMQPSAGTKSE